MITNNMEYNSCLGDVLPVQSHYYILSDGKHVAVHGSPDERGVLIFICAEQAEEFVNDGRVVIDGHVPLLKPEPITSAQLLSILRRVGICIADATGYRVIEA